MPQQKTTKEAASYGHVLKYTGLFGGVQVLTMLVALVRNKIAALLLGPSGMAIVALLNNAVSLINQGTNFGISFSAVKHVAELSETDEGARMEPFVQTVRLWSLLTAALGMAVCFLCSPLLSRWTFEAPRYTPTFMLLSLMVAMLAITGGEIAILKGSKQLKKVAIVSTLTALATLLICCPIYYFYGTAGIAPALVLSQAAILAVHLHFSTKVFPWRLPIGQLRERLAAGRPMMKLGTAFIVAGIFGKGAEYLTRTLLLRLGSLSDVGLYSTGYALTVGYTSLVFMAIEADFFPRLAACQGNRPQQNRTINQQIEVCLLLITPILIAAALFMPTIIRLLYSTAFYGAVPMAVCATFFMFFKSLTLPVAYLPLARGDSLMYMVTELADAIFVVVAIPLCFNLYGMRGAGLALSLSGLLYMLLIHQLYRRRYGYRFARQPLPVYALQLLLLIAAVAAALSDSRILHWMAGLPLLAISTLISLHILRKRDALAQLHFLHRRKKRR